jgi:hypothetical protein
LDFVGSCFRVIGEPGNPCRARLAAGAKICVLTDGTLKFIRGIAVSVQKLL